MPGCCMLYNVVALLRSVLGVGFAGEHGAEHEADKVPFCPPSPPPPYLRWPKSLYKALPS